MGIKGIWDIINPQEEVVVLAQLAEDHYKLHSRPLRIAIDEASWHFDNVTQAQVFTIRDKSSKPYRGIEKLIFHRICRVLKLNIDLIFVFDGPRRPHKRNKGGQGKIDYEARRPLYRVLRNLRVPYHEAPAEAEAECARLQQLGIVDAVWSEDSDALMFGCDFFIRTHRISKHKNSKDCSKENTKKDDTHVRVHRAFKLRDVHNLDREGLVLFAMLSGGDYDIHGLPGCGPGRAMEAVRAGLGKSLCDCRTARACQAWGDVLRICLGRKHPNPNWFPDIKTLTKYDRPIVTEDTNLLDLPCLRGGWRRAINELYLMTVTGEYFDMWGKSYLNWVAPILLIRAMVEKDGQRPDNPYQIKIKKKRVAHPPFLLELAFSPFSVSILTAKDFEGEKQGSWTGKRNELFEPEYRVDCALPSFWLAKSLPQDVLEPLPSPKKIACKRKKDKCEDEQRAASPKRKRTPAMTPQAKPVETSKPTNISSKKKTVKASGPSSAMRSKGVDMETIDIFSSDEEAIQATRLDKQKLPTFLSAQPPKLVSSGHIDFGPDLSGSSDDEDEGSDMAKAIRLSLAEHSNSHSSAASPALQRSDQDRDTVRGEREDPDGCAFARSSSSRMATKPNIASTTKTATPTNRPLPRSETTDVLPTHSYVPRHVPKAVAKYGWSFSPVASDIGANHALDSSPTTARGSHQPYARTRPPEEGSSSVYADTMANGSGKLSPPPSIPQADPNYAAQIRAARLRHFACAIAPDADLLSMGPVRKASVPSLPSGTLTIRTTPAKVMKKVEHEVIDLTDL